MSDDYARGQRDGLRLALAVLEAEEAKWSALLGESSSWRTNFTREVRHKAAATIHERPTVRLEVDDRAASWPGRFETPAKPR